MEPCGELRGTLRVGALWSESKPCRERRIGSMGAQGLVRCVLRVRTPEGASLFPADRLALSTFV